MLCSEVAVGQYLGEGGMTLVGRLCPLLGGTGPATMVLVRGTHSSKVSTLTPAPR